MKRFVMAGALAALAVLGGAATTASAQSGGPDRPGIQARQRPAAQRLRAVRAARQRWRRMDADRNGFISRDEWRGRPAVFERLDRNHDGFLTRAEFARGLRRAARRARI